MRGYMLLLLFAILILAVIIVMVLAICYMLKIAGQGKYYTIKKIVVSFVTLVVISVYIIEWLSQNYYESIGENLATAKTYAGTISVIIFICGYFFIELDSMLS